MEFLILLLLGGLAAGVGVWASRGDQSSSGGGGGGNGAGPRSSPGLPAGGGPRPPVVGRRAGDTVTIGEDEVDEDESAGSTGSSSGESEPLPQTQAGPTGESEARPEKRDAKRKPPVSAKEGLSLPHPVDSIIPRSSPHSHQRRMLQNAESMAMNDRVEEAIKLSNRVKDRIPEPEVTSKIEENVQAMEDFLDGIGSLESEDTPEAVKAKETPTIAIEQLAEGLKSIAEGLLTQIQHTFYVVPGAPAQQTGEPIPEGVAAAPSAKAEGTIQNIQNIFQAPPPMDGEPMRSGVDWKFRESTRTHSILSGITVDEHGKVITAGMNDEDFEKEWEKYKNLPLKDRRQGDDRRRDGEDDMDAYRDRRGDRDRRKQDLFKERDEFLGLLEEHKKNKKIYEEYSKVREEDVDDEAVSMMMPFVRKGKEPEIRVESENIITDRDPLLMMDVDEPTLRIESGSITADEDEEPEPEQTESSLPDPVELEIIPASETIEKEVPELFALPAPVEDIPEEPLPPAMLPEGLDEPLEKEEMDEPLEEEAPPVVHHFLPEGHDIIDPPVAPDLPPIPPSFLPEGRDEDLTPEDRDGVPHPMEEEPEPLIIEAGSVIIEEALSESEDEDDDEMEDEDGFFPPQISMESTPPDLDKLDLPDPVELEPEELPLPGGPGEVGGEELEDEDSDIEIPEIEPIDDEDDKPPPVQEIRGVLELKPPEEDDAPYLALTYDFSRIPDSFKLSQDYHTMEYAYYKYKPMLIKAQEFTRRKMLKNALNYYRVIKSQNIPPEFRRMINRNIQDITDYLEKYLMGR